MNNVLVWTTFSCEHRLFMNIVFVWEFFSHEHRFRVHIIFAWSRQKLTQRAYLLVHQVIKACVVFGQCPLWDDRLLRCAQFQRVYCEIFERALAHVAVLVSRHFAELVWHQGPRCAGGGDIVYIIGVLCKRGHAPRCNGGHKKRQNCKNLDDYCAGLKC